MRGIGDPQSTPTAFYVTAGTIVVVVAVLFIQAFYLRAQQELERERVVERPYALVVEQREAQRALLDTYGWTDEERTSVRIPISKAMDLYLEEARQK